MEKWVLRCNRCTPVGAGMLVPEEMAERDFDPAKNPRMGYAAIAEYSRGHVGLNLSGLEEVCRHCAGLLATVGFIELTLHNAEVGTLKINLETIETRIGLSLNHVTAVKLLPSIEHRILDFNYVVAGFAVPNALGDLLRNYRKLIWARIGRTI